MVKRKVEGRHQTLFRMHNTYAQINDVEVLQIYFSIQNVRNMRLSYH